MKNSKFILAFILVMLFILACKKRKIDFCFGVKQTIADFKVMEMVDDTAFEADTMFKHHYASFVSNINYDTVLWQIGQDPRTWAKKSFNLPMFNAWGTIDVNFKAKLNKPNACFPEDSGLYVGKKKLTFYEYEDKTQPDFKISPMVGKYRGVNSNNLLDTFIIRIDYFDSLKYTSPSFFRKNFYWFSNFPKGFKSTSGVVLYNGDKYNELKDGFAPDIVYKSIRSGDINLMDYFITGWLKDNNTIILHNRAARQEPYTFIGKRIE